VALIRELGVTVGAAALGGLLSARLLAGLGARASLAGLSPDQLRAQPAHARHAYAEAYLSAFTPLMAGLAVLFLAGVVVALPLPDRRLGDGVVDIRSAGTKVSEVRAGPLRGTTAETSDA
jgi:hypothetical protein